MSKSARPPANSFVKAMRHVYNPLGFSKGYNFILWFITLGYLFGFTLARTMYFSFYGVFCNTNAAGGNGAAPGECYYYLRNPWRIGMQLHLFCILPAAILVCFQFTPWVRHKLLLFHRINGYLVILLSLTSSAGVLIIAQVAFDGDFATRSWAGALVITTTLCYIMAYVNIKLLQIDQHRAWMIRCWALFATIITIRSTSLYPIDDAHTRRSLANSSTVIMITGGNIISSLGGWFTTKPCAQINFAVGKRNTLQLYPICESFFNGTNLDQHAIVEANFSSSNPNEIAASLGIPFGAAGWISFWLHAVAVEIYLRLTPAESERLRQVSYERQLKAGFKRPDYAGLVAERFGDANEYVPLKHLETSQRYGQSTAEEDSNLETSY